MEEEEEGGEGRGKNVEGENRRIRGRRNEKEGEDLTAFLQSCRFDVLFVCRFVVFY